jgi:microcystin-dependent protein
MSADPYLGEIQIFPYTYAPRGWAYCDGQIIPIAQNQALFSIISTIYGGNGTTTMGLPDFRGRIPIGLGRGPGLTERRLGYPLGTQSVILQESQIATHTHFLSATIVDIADSTDPLGSCLAKAPKIKTAKAAANHYHDETGGLVTMSPSSLGSTGGTQPHNNIQPILGLSFYISMDGVYPPRS